MNNQTKDRIKLLRFEIENLKRRKMECINDAGAIAVIQYEIQSRNIELSFLEIPPVPVHFSFKCTAKDDELLLADSNDYRERYFE